MASTPCQQGDFGFGKWDQAGAQAFYACKYFQSIEDTNFWRNAIAAVQAATQIYFADKQHTIATRQQDRLDNISNIELNRSGKIFAQWEKGVTCEDAQLLEACGMKVEKPDINDIRRRISADVKRAFAGVKKQLRECYPISCAAAMCSELNKTAREEARTIVGVTSAAYQKEILLYEQRLATAKSWRYQVLAFGRGSIQASTVLMQGAAQNAQLASQINPWRGWTQAINGIAETGQRISLQEANSFRGMGINMRQQISNPNTDGTQVTSSYNFQLPTVDDGGVQLDSYGQSPTGITSDGTLGSSTDIGIRGDAYYANPIANIG
jgi:hypothetical protein